MNFGELALIMLCAVGAVLCVYVIAAGTSSTAFVDSQGNTTSAQSNASRLVVGNGTAPVSGAVGGGLVVIIAVLLVIFVVGGIAVYASKTTHSNFRSRYR